jgi:hypothetical protein
MLIFIGTLVNSDPPEQVRIVQHVSQLNIRLRSIPVREHKKARKITGFGPDLDPPDLYAEDEEGRPHLPVNLPVEEEDENQ